MKRQILALFSALCLCLTLVPATPAAASDMSKVEEYNAISAGGSHTAAIDENGFLWMWGYNGSGQLGNGTKTDRTTPVKVLDNVASVSCGRDYTAAIKNDGSLWTWGYNYSGQLGDGTTEDSAAPVKVLDNVAAVSCGSGYTAAIKTDGSLWTWGKNDCGQLGNGSTAQCLLPVKVLDNVAAVSCGVGHTAGIKSDGSLWVWGSNGYGQRGDGTSGNISTPKKVLDNVAAVSCGDSHTAAIKTDGSLWTWGDNGDGQLGNGTNANRSTPVKVLDDAMAVSCGRYHTAAIKSDGSLWTWGWNSLGQLGTGSESNSLRPIKVLNDVVEVSCGGCHTTAIKSDSSLWTWGENDYGQLGYEGGNAKSSQNKSYQTVPKQMTGVTTPKGVRLYLNGGIGCKLLWAGADGTIKVPTNPTRAGYTFGGWYVDEALTKPWNFNGQVVNGLVLYAKWVRLSSTASNTSKSTQIVSLNGNTITLDAYTLKADSNGGDVTYVKLRDVAALLDGTSNQFNVDWRNGAIYVSTNSAYTTKNGTELRAISGTDGSYKWNTSPILFDGMTQPLEGIVICDSKGGGHTFFKLRDLGAAIGFDVGWSAERGIYIEAK